MVEYLDASIWTVRLGVLISVIASSITNLGMLGTASCILRLDSSWWRLSGSASYLDREGQALSALNIESRQSAIRQYLREASHDVSQGALGEHHPPTF